MNVNWSRINYLNPTYSSFRHYFPSHYPSHQIKPINVETRSITLPLLGEEFVILCRKPAQKNMNSTLILSLSCKITVSAFILNQGKESEMDKKIHQNVNSNINRLSSCCFARFSISVTSGCLSAPSAALSPLSVWIFVFGLVKVPVLILLDEPPII